MTTNPSMMTDWLRLAILSSVVEGMRANGFHFPHVIRTNLQNYYSDIDQNYISEFPFPNSNYG